MSVSEKECGCVCVFVCEREGVCVCEREGVWWCLCVSEGVGVCV